MLNPSKGNMYPFVTHTWNTVKGKCPHDCSYCYMKRFGNQKPTRFDRKELNVDLGEGNFIFVGSSCDMWANDIQEKWIQDTLDHCKKYDNKYLYQTKNPERIYILRSYLPFRSIVGTTIETNRVYPQMGYTPDILNRSWCMNCLSESFKTMVTVEPIMDFDLTSLTKRILICNPSWVNIGADSQGHSLPEPSSEKIQALIGNLKDSNIEVKLKSNLKRLFT